MTLEPREFDAMVEPQEAQGRVTPTKGPVEMRDFDDPVAIRKNIFSGVKTAYQQRVTENKEHVLRFADVDYDTPKDFTIQDEKNAILGRRRLYWNLKGRLQLLDKATGAVISEDAKPRKLAEVPYVTRRGTFVHNGTEYLTSHQMRLKPGAYTRVQNNGDVETQFNVLKGSSFRVHMTPETGVFRINAGQAQMKLYPVLKALGIQDKALLEAWGKDLFNANKAADDKTEGSTVQKLVQRLGSHNDQELSPEDAMKRLPEIFQRMELDPEVMRRTLGKPHARVDQNVILDATKKILRVHQSQEDPDDRDDLPYQSFHGPEDFFREHVEKDAGQYLRQALWKAGFKKSTEAIPEGYFTKQLQSVILGSGLSSSLTEINPAEIYDMRHKITRLGEGGIGSSDVVPKGARGVQPTHFGFIDPLRAPESQKIALDLRTTQGTKVGSDGRLYQRFWSPRKKAFEYIHTDAAADHTIAFPGELEKAAGKPKQKVRAMVKGRMSYVPAAKVDYELPHASGMWSPLTWMVPFMSGVKGARVGMGARMQSQALALKEPEAPLVMPVHQGSGKGFHEHIGEQMGAVKAKKPGVVKKVTPEGIEVQHMDGTTELYETYSHMPFNQKGFLHNTPVVKPGEMVNPGGLLARSNYTDEKGRAAIGRNVTAAWHMLDGLTHEDAIAISESAAKKFASEQMYEFSKERGEDIHEISKNAYISQYPSVYTKQQLERMDDDGVVTPGTVLKKGDPIILAVGKHQGAIKGSIMKGRKSAFSDAAETWDHEAEGEVVEVRKTPKGPVVTLRSYTPVKPADKLSGLFGNKGVVSKIIPDAEMLQTSDGKPVDIVMNPMGIISRVNPASLAEAALGKIAKRTGKPYVVEGFPKGSIAQFALDELAKNGMSDTETVIDPKTGRRIRDVFVGVPYVMKLHHMAEGKMGARETAHYTMDGLPAKGGPESSRRFGFMEVMGLMSHGVPHFVEDMKLTRGQRNDEYWRMYRLGMTPATPRVSRQYQKFETMLQAAGVSLRKKDSSTQIFPATQKEIEALGGSREITKGETVDFDTGEPAQGGLFDVALTGGQGGEHWSHIKLAEPLPNPLMEDPFRAFLGLTKDKYRELLAGREAYNGVKGPTAIHRALETFNVPREIAATSEAIKSGKKSARDRLVKRLGFLKAFERLGAHPRDFLLDRVPVLPPKFRPVSKFKETTISADANFLYKDLIEANENLKASKETFGDENTADVRLQAYDAFKAVVGLGDPIQPETRERNVRGLLKQIVGSSPKYGNYQRRVIGNPVDFSGRAVIIPGQGVDIDEVGLPVDMMWTLFKPFTIRKLSRSGMPMQVALKEWKERTPRATQALMAEAAVRPVVINRAPTLHKYNLTGHYAKPVAGHAMQLNNLILKGHGADYDGDSGRFVLELLISEGTSWVTHEGVPMPFAGNTDVAIVAHARIQDIPVIQGSEVQLSEGVKEYDVSPGIQVYALDPKTLEHRLYPVTKFSVHENLDMRLVTIGKRYQTSLLVSADHSLICYKDGKVQPVKPDEAVGLMVPVVRHMDETAVATTQHVSSVRFRSGKYAPGETQGAAIDMECELPLNREMGFFLGALIGDGWIDAADCILLSNDDPDVREAWFQAAVQHTPAHGTGRVMAYDAPSLGGKVTTRHKLAVNCAWLARWLRNHVGEGAKNKRIPGWCYSGSEEHLMGILDGLLSTDGCVGLNTARSKPQLLISMTTISADLVQDLQYLGRRLGFQTSVSLGKVTQADNQAYIVTFSTPDFMAFQRRSGFTVTAKWKQQRLLDYGTSIGQLSSCAASTDLVPYPQHLHAKLRATARSQAKDMKAADAATTAMCTAARNGCWSRLQAVSTLAATEDPEFAEYIMLITDNKITWKQVLSVEVAPRETGYDLTVPGPLTFATYDGVIVQDTLGVHVPVSDKAIDDIKEKMLPSKMLYSQKNFDVHMLPEQGFVTGLYMGSHENKKRRPRTFASKVDAVKAYRSGELDADDPIVILRGT